MKEALRRYITHVQCSKEFDVIEFRKQFSLFDFRVKSDSVECYAHKFDCEDITRLCKMIGSFKYEIAPGQGGLCLKFNV